MRTLAAFDFDGTLARGDSLLPFLMRLIGGRRVAHAILAHAPALGLIGVGKGDRDRTKERFIAHTLAGHPAEEIHAIGKDFAGELLRTRMFPNMVERVHWHKRQGHELVLVSATLDVYLDPLAAELGFDKTLTTRLEIVDGRATGRLLGGNVRAAAKAALLKAHLGEDDAVDMWGYGNSAGDHDMLALAEHPFYVKRDGTMMPWRRSSDR